MAIVILVLMTALLDEQHNYWFQPAASAKDILRQSVMLGIYALGAAIVIIAGGIDLSSGSMIAFSGSICATLIHLLAKGQLDTRSRSACWSSLRPSPARCWSGFWWAAYTPG